MTVKGVKKITDAQRGMIKYAYENKTQTITQMAKNLSTSTRTIGRVLNEMGLFSTNQQNKATADRVLALMKQYNVGLGELQMLLVFERKGPTTAQVVKHMVELPEEQYNKALEQVVTGRVAVKFNKNVQTSMLNIQNKVEQDAKQ